MQPSEDNILEEVEKDVREHVSDQVMVQKLMRGNFFIINYNENDE